MTIRNALRKSQLSALINQQHLNSQLECRPQAKENPVRPLRIFGCFILAVTQFVVLTEGQESAVAKAEFAARRAKLFEQISDGVAVVFAGEEEGAAPVRFRQLPDFYYLYISTKNGAGMAFTPIVASGPN